MPCISGTCQGAAPSQQLGQTSLTKGVGAGQDPWYQVSTLLKILETNLTEQDFLQTIYHDTIIEISLKFIEYILQLMGRTLQ